MSDSNDAAKEIVKELSDGVCDTCTKKDSCITYQNNLYETHRILFGCSCKEE